MARKISVLRYGVGYVSLLALVSLNLGLSLVGVPTFVTATIAAVTIGIVVLVFMHLLEHGPTLLVVMLTCLFFLVLLAGLLLLDVRARAPEPLPAFHREAAQEPG
jgi:hypothetical protein